MPGTRTSPTIDGTPTFKEISIRWIDAVGDRRSDMSMIDPAATDVQMETLILAMQAGSNASNWAVRVVSVYEGAMTKANALAAVRISEQDNIVYHAKNVGRVDRRSFLPAPIEANFVANTETPDETSTTLVNLMATWDAVWADTFSGVSLRFSERREINEKVNL